MTFEKIEITESAKIEFIPDVDCLSVTKNIETSNGSDCLGYWRLHDEFGHGKSDADLSEKLFDLICLKAAESLINAMKEKSKS